MKCFYACQKVESVEAFEDAYNAMLAKFDLRENRHLRGLYEVRAMWAQPFLRPYFFAGMSTTQRSESYNAFLKVFMGSQTSLLAFFRHVRCIAAVNAH